MLTTTSKCIESWSFCANASLYTLTGKKNTHIHTHSLTHALDMPSSEKEEQSAERIVRVGAAFPRVMRIQLEFLIRAAARVEVVPGNFTMFPTETHIIKSCNGQAAIMSNIDEFALPVLKVDISFLKDWIVLSILAE